MEYIHSYSRKQALEDGVLVDVTRYAREAGFKVPVAFTRTLFESVGGDRKGVMGTIFNFFINHDKEKYHAQFHQKIGEERLPVFVHLHNGDEGEPVVTFMFTEED